ncbi:MAG: hypothetical protein HC830_06360 [Bacteroidetes bacterium]|nr:hypothetical protein [Bacteroidota bacterium]
MKKYFSIILIILVYSSCSKDFLDEKTFGLIRPSAYFSSLSDLEKCVNALYSNGNMMYNESATLVACMGGDDVTTLSGGNKSGFLQFDVFSAQDNNDRLGNSYNGAFGTIKQANVIITNIDRFIEPQINRSFFKIRKTELWGKLIFSGLWLTLI